MKKVKLYTLSTCSHCIHAKEFFKNARIKIDFQDVDLLSGSERERVVAEIKRLNPDCSFPTICIDDVVLSGFNEEKVRKELGL
jgi:glutaredoxin-like protein NrdH